ncbi:glutathione S-transferase U8 [Citrus sinensis]|uniref:glutathione transferase n=1 Tax=Citrus clementina TaxID=85681 RepID=V4USD1_CITCL|nr:glutathione S-transferase U8 [Citrus x clementina]XP_006480913.1 glutathione S-transferase U8-like [Citrus sinensis]ESR42474.1 hypothetical protein CICLE_v10012717mg [Citrus x clementina]KAH9672627.1 glutathione S-transferase U8 [Citrus sinensis]
MAEVQLFGLWGSFFSHRIEIALKLKGVEYEFIEEDLSNKSPLLLQYNSIHKKVPVLVHKGNPIAESRVILEYIDDTWKGHPILPENPHERANARFWAQFIDEKCRVALRNAYGCQEKEREEEATREACELLKTLENELKDRRFFGGDRIGLVDIVANFIGFWLGAIQEALEVKLFTEERFPKLYRWSEEFVNCSIIRESLPPRDKLISFMRRRYGLSS